MIAAHARIIRNAEMLMEMETIILMTLTTPLYVDVLIIQSTQALIVVSRPIVVVVD